MNASFPALTLGQRSLVPLAVCALLCTNPATHAGEIYKSVDAKGHVNYSDRPSPSATRVTVPPVSKGTEAERKRISEQMNSYSWAEAERSRKLEEEQKKLAEEEATQEYSQELCRRARDRYRTISEARRPYRGDDRGNRVYYSSAEIDAERAAAQMEMDLRCSAK